VIAFMWFRVRRVILSLSCRKPGRRAGDHQRTWVWLLPHQVWTQGLLVRWWFQQHLLRLCLRIQDSILAAGERDTARLNELNW
jgi:hypothetical protein